MSVSLVVPRRFINARLRLRFPPRKSADSGIPGEHRGIAPLHLVRRDVLDRMADHPVVAEGVAQGAGALPVEIDRKSVVEGKRVSVRVDAGGRPSITKKKKTIL